VGKEEGKGWQGWQQQSGQRLVEVGGVQVIGTGNDLGIGVKRMLNRSLS
jgi:hypothetical protein